VPAANALTPTLVVGGGPAGAAAAIVLARAGGRPLVIERQRDTGDALCGGFLSWRSLATLAALGIDADDLTRRRVTRVRILHADRVAEAALPRPAIGVSRRRLDTLLLARAAAEGAAVERGVTVRAIEGRTAMLADGAAIAAGALLLASGKHDVRGTARPASARGPDPALGLRVRLPPHPALARLVGDAIELHPFRGGYAGVVMQEDGSVNLCMAVRRSRLRAAGGPAALLLHLSGEAPRLGERLGFAYADPDAVANVPYGWRATSTVAGVYRLGDQAGVIPSLAGEGMGIALASGRAAAGALLAGEAAEAWQRRTAAALARPLRAAGWLRRAAEMRGGGALLSRLPAPLIQMSAQLTRFTP